MLMFFYEEKEANELIDFDNFKIIKYNINYYSDSLFEKYNIAIPNHIFDKSVLRKSEFLAGRISAKKSLHFDDGVFHLDIGLNKEPLWPNTFNGSISHSGGYACAVSSKVYDCIGIDLEPIVENELADFISFKILNKKELKILHSMKTIPFNLLFTIIFSSKECFFKAIYPKVNKNLSFDTINIIDININTGECKFKVNSSIIDMDEINTKFYIYKNMVISACCFNLF